VTRLPKRLSSTGLLRGSLKPLAALLASGLISTGAQAADLAHGKRVFQSCSSCHVIDSEANRFGPTLKGVVGRKAGSVPDFRYSQAMKDAGAAGLVWDDASLGAFLYSPKRKVPGTSMRFFGLWTQSEIDDVIAYLKANP